MGDLNLYLDQLYTFICFLFTGFIIGILFDIFRILRKSFKNLDFITYIQDVIFWILTGALLLYSIFTFNNGELRSYIFVGIVLGIILYMLIFSNFIIKLTTKLINILKKVIAYPLRKIYSFINTKIARPIYNLINRSFKKILLSIKKTNNSNFQPKE